MTRHIGPLLVLLCALGTRGLSAQSSWNAHIAHFSAAMSLPAADGPGFWLGEPAVSSSFTQGEAIHLVCRAELTATKAPPAWSIEIWQGSVMLMSQPMPASTAQPRFALASVVAGTPGTYQAQCRLKLQDASTADNSATLSYKVVPRVGEIAGSLPVPPPVILQPAAGARIPAGSTVQLTGRVPMAPFGNKPDFAAYAKGTSTEERWRLELVRLGDGPRARSTLVRRFERIITGTEFGAEETIAGPGRYQLRALVLQQVSGGIRPSPVATVGFEVFKPLVANQADQPAPTATTPPQQPVARPRIPVPRERTP